MRRRGGRGLEVRAEAQGGAMRPILIVGFGRYAALALTALLASGCGGGATLVATDVKVVDKPVAVPCKFDLPIKPVPYVPLVQLAGVPMVDLVTIWRAAEAELEARIAYELKLEAAAVACRGPP